MTWSFTPFVFLLVVPGLVAMSSAAYAWRQGRLALASPFMFLTLSSALWALIHVGEIVGGDLSTKLFWAKAQYLGIAFVPVAWLTVGLQYTNRQHWLTRRNLVWLSIIPVWVLVMTWTNDGHGLIWRETSVKEAGPFSVLGVTYGPAFWVGLAYQYALLVVGTGLLLTMVVRSPRFYLGQRLVLIAAVMFPWLANVAYFRGWGPAFDLTPFVFALSAVATSYGVLRFQLIDIVPIARDVVLENMTDALLVLDTENRVVDINPAASDLFDRPARAAMGLPVGDVVGPQPDLSPETFEKDYARAEMEIGTGASGRILTADISLLRDGAGEPAGRLMVCRDITARKKALEEATLRARAREFVTNATTAFLTVQPDRVDTLIVKTLGELGAFTESDRCWLSTFDMQTLQNIDSFEWTAPGVATDLGQGVSLPFASDGWGVRQLDERQTLLIPSVSRLPPEARVEQAALQDRGVKSCLAITLTLVWKSRTVKAFLGLDAVRVERTWEKGAGRLASTIGEVAIGALYRSRSEVQLRESEARLLEAQRIAGVGRWTWDLTEGRFVWPNEVYAMLGVTPASVDGSMTSLMALVVEEDRARVVRDGVSFAETGRPNAVEWRVRRPDGEERHLYAKGERLVSPAGEVTLVGTVQDVTQRRQLEADRRAWEVQAQHAQKLEGLGVMSSGIAHDFNNLLLGIMGNAELARESVARHSEGEAYLENVVKISEQAADLCKQLLAYAGRGTVVVQAVDLSRTVEELADLLALSVSKGARLRYELDQGEPAIEADATQIRQILMNLLTNASDALNEEGGDIVVRTGTMECNQRSWSTAYFDDGLPDGRYAYVEVSDSGVGMDDATRKRMFDPFFTSKSTGRGLGLAAALGIIRSHRGAIHVRSEPGRGTTIRVLFPVSRKTPDAAPARADDHRPWQQVATVLVVDDDQSVRAFCSATFKRAGLEVVTAEDGLEAVRVYGDRGAKIDLVLLDLTMPRMSGVETLDALLKPDPRVCVILTSAYGEPAADDRHDNTRGYRAFIQKPYRPKALLQLVRDVLEVGDSHDAGMSRAVRR